MIHGQTFKASASASASAVALILALPAAAGAETLYSDESRGIVLDAGLEAGAGIFAMSNGAFGSLGPGLPDKDPSWREGYLKPSLTGSLRLGGYGSLFGGTSAVLSSTWGDGDAAGMTPGSPENMAVDEAYFGWRSDDALKGIGIDSLSISAGRQGFQIGDGFLIADGHMDQGHEAAYWWAPRRAFAFAGLGQVDAGRVHVDLFGLRTDQFLDVPGISQDTKAVGANLEYRHDQGTLGTTVLRVTDSDVATRDGLDIVDLRAKGNPFDDALPGLDLASEIVIQRNDSPDVSAEGWYVQAGYTFRETPWSPSISYRFAHFDGDDPTTATNEAYDPLFFGFTGWGTWFMGEIVGEYMLANSNEQVHMVHTTVQPLEDVTVGVMGYRFYRDQTSGTGDHYADEVDLYTDWVVNEHLVLSALYGAARPGAAAKASFGDDETAQLIEVLASVHF